MNWKNKKKMKCYNCLVRNRTSKILGLCDRCISFAVAWKTLAEKAAGK